MPCELVASPRARTSVCREEAADAVGPARRSVLCDMPGLRPEVAQGRGYGRRAYLHGTTASTSATASSAMLWSLERNHDVQLERRSVPHRSCCWCWRRRDEREEKEEREGNNIDECPQDHVDEDDKDVE